ncbi:MAG: GxxExxY protein [Verrucomicrobiota bacterium]
MQLTKEELPHVVIGACMEVHKELGPGFAVEAYREALAHELRMREVLFKRDEPLKVSYKGAEIATTAKLDFVVEELVILRTVAASKVGGLEKEILASQLRTAGIETGLIVNFWVEKFRDGVKRLIVSNEEPNVHFRETVGF